MHPKEDDLQGLARPKKFLGLDEVLGHEKSLRVESQIWDDAPGG
jgi:hypothetical protein